MAKKQMKKSVRILIIVLSSILALVGVLALLFGVILKPKEIPTFSFSGYVFADGEALAGAKVSCGVKDTETNEEGYYEFSGLTSVVEVVVSKDNYLFKGDLVFVNSNKQVVNFSGFEKFSINGVVRNGDELVADAEIVAVSEMGVYKTRSNDFGAFALPNLAGEVKLSASHHSISLFSQTFDKEKTSLVVTGETTLSGKINCDSDVGYDFVLKLNGEVVEIGEGLSFYVGQVRPNSVLTLESDNYHIEKNEITINMENCNFDFCAEKFYNVTGSVTSGTKLLANARIVVGGVKTYSNSCGQFELRMLHGKNTINASLQGYKFESVEVDNSHNETEFIGSFDLSGRVISDDNVYSDVTVSSGEKVANVNSKGEFVLTDVQIGDTVTIKSPNHYIASDSLVVNSLSRITFELQKLYDLSIDIDYLDLPLQGVTAIVAGKSYSSDSAGEIVVQGLYGINTFVLFCGGYKFDDIYMADRLHTNLVVKPYKYYDIQGVIKSGDNIVSGATIQIAGDEYISDEQGCFEFVDVYSHGELKVLATNFNSETLPYSIDNCNLEINLTYDIDGLVKCGNYPVDNVRVTVGNNSIYSDYSGRFSIKGLSGNQTISFEKSGYTFEDKVVSSGENVTIPCSYSITGKAMGKDSYIAGLKIVLVPEGSDSGEVCTTGEGGSFSFSGLVGRYLLMYDTEYSGTLLPGSYDITGAGIYNFSDTGYSFGGRVMTGDGLDAIPVAGVQVRAGELVTTTNEYGIYKFNLIIGEETLELSKDGYVFDNNGLAINREDYDKRTDVDFSATYSISGQISCGLNYMSGVRVVVGNKECTTDEEGKYTISGLAGKVYPEVYYDGYYFDNPNEITKAGVYNINAMFNSSVNVRTGSVGVSGVQILLNGKTFETNANGVAVVEGVQIGDKLEFVKDGYVFSDYVVEQYKSEIVVSGTYSIVGKVMLVDAPLVGVQVSCNGNVVITDERGYFEFLELSDSQEITFVKDNYTFDILEVSGYESLEIFAKFSVSGKVSVAGSGLENVLVKAGEIETYTDSFGNYEINNIQNREELTFEKYGYVIYGEFVVDSPRVIDVEASFKISGRVMSGDIVIAGAQVKISNGVTVVSDEHGYFECSGIDEVVNLEVVADGYNLYTLSGIDRFRNDINPVLNYGVTITFSNITNLSDISIQVGGVVSSYSENAIVLENLVGEVRIAISKDGYNFNPSVFVVSKSVERVVVVKKEFSVSGTIKTSTSAIPVAGVMITAGGKETITDANGKYSLSGFVDPVQIKLLMKVTDTAYKGENYEYSVIVDQVESDVVRDYNVNDNEYAYFLFKKGYQNLNDANSYQIFGRGTVSDNTSKANQSIHVVYKKDSKNHRIIQNLNWYHEKVSGIVEARIVQLSYVDMDAKTIAYQTVTGTNVQDGTANWSTNWTKNVGYQQYLDDFGVNAEGYYPYVINPSTIQSTSEVTLQNGLYTFTFSMKEASYQYYTTQMAHMCSSQSFNGFKYCNLTYTIGQDGYIRSMSISEQYEVKATIVVTVYPIVTANITYTFLTTSGNEVINDIKIGTVAEINASLAQEEIKYQATTYRTLLNCDLYYEKRRILI